MVFVLADRVRESSTTTGTGAIALGGAPNASYQAFSAAMSIGDTCWYAIVLPGSAWETGNGTYSGANTLTRTSVIASSNAGAAVSFGAGTKDVFICQPALESKPFPTGTLMLFQQTSAPIFWTKQATHNDKALRVVSGTAGSGGTNAFSAISAQSAIIANTTITVSTMANHNHTTTAKDALTAFGVGTGANDVPISTGTIGFTGGNGAHSHSISGVSFDVQYVDLIIASKD